MSAFLLDPDVIFLNHGSFGACPTSVFDEYQRWQRTLERQPVKFLARELPGLLAESRRRVAEFLGAKTDEIAFVANPTFAVNTVARCLPLGPGDEVLTTDHEYGACRFAWQFAAEKRGFHLVTQPISLPVESEDGIVEEFWRGVTNKTKLLFLSHITSATALTLPVEKICRRAHDEGIMTMIDGAHAPAQVDVSLRNLQADFYTATCHKWMCAPKGSGIFFVREDRQELIEPLVVGWGWGNEKTIHRENPFIEQHEWLGTHDPSAYLTVPAAIDWQREFNPSAIRQRSRKLAQLAVESTTRIDGVERVHPDGLYQQMGLVDVTARESDADKLKTYLWERFQIEVPVTRWRDRTLIRVSTHVYTTERHIEVLVMALSAYKA